MPSSFTIRVYGILLHRQRLLVSDEYYRKAFFTKFPGGGLQFGEGTTDCLRREMSEELGLSVTVGRHYYTTDFFQRSAFDPDCQVLSIYYLVALQGPLHLATKEQPFDFTVTGERAQACRWIPVDRLHPGDLTFPIDQRVASLLLQDFENGTVPV